jgi:hypothetical protein
MLLNLDPERKYFNTFDTMEHMTAEDINKLDPDIMPIVIRESKRRGRTIPRVYTVQIADKVERIKPLDTWNGTDFRHALVALFLLHENGICHNDLHVGNIGFKNNLPVFYDFDMAKENCSVGGQYDDIQSIFEEFVLLAQDHKKQVDFQRFLASSNVASTNASNTGLARLNIGQGRFIPTNSTSSSSSSSVIFIPCSKNNSKTKESFSSSSCNT